MFLALVRGQAAPIEEALRALPPIAVANGPLGQIRPQPR